MNEIKPPRVIYAKPLPDYSERLSRRTGSTEAIVESKFDTGRRTDHTIQD